MSRSPLMAASTARRLATAEAPAVLRFEDLSLRPRFGCKGPGAPAWLATAGWAVPAGANSAILGPDGVLVARLATSEFLIEAAEGGASAVTAAGQKLGVDIRPATVYPVARQDLVMGIQGPGLQALLRQVCSVDFAPLWAAETGSVVLTSMIGVGVVAWPRRGPSGPALTLWLDPSFAHYFWTTLLEVGHGVGVVAIGSKT